MKKINIKNKICVALLTGMVFSQSACTDLSETLYSDIATEKTNFTDADIKNLIAPAFSNLRSVYWGWDGMFDIYEESSDLLMTPYRIGTGWGDYYITMHKHTYHSSVSHFYNLWNFGYKGIGSINNVLDLQNPVVDEYRPELRAMRALFYYYLFDNFRNIPLLTTNKLEAGFLPSQVGQQEMYDFIVSELNEVKETISTSTTNYGHMNRYAVNMLLAKMYLNHNAWFGGNDNTYYQKALAEVNEIIAAGKYSLAPNYTDPFKDNLASCPEVIFAVPFDIVYASGNYLSNKALHGGSAATFGLSSAPWNGSCAVPQFIDTYDADDARLKLTWLIGTQYTANGNVILVNGSPMVYTKDVSSIDNPGAYEFEGARFHKYQILPGNVGTYSDDVPLFRLSDAYFIKAECLLRLGQDEQTAADLVTQVRRRAFTANASKAVRTVAELKGASVYNYGHYENGKWKTVEGGNNIELGGLLDDLAWEFVGEHHRRQDLIRFKVSGTDVNVYTGKSWFCKDAETSAANYKNVFPISQTFLDANMNLKQNPGY